MRPVKPAQQKIRDDLAQIVETQQNSRWQRPIAEHSEAAFAQVRQWVDASSKPLILDSCCGTGDSTRQLARTFPHAQVLGIDKSAHRLARHQRDATASYTILRADVNDFWRLALHAGWRPLRHYLFYPNPYPKASQVRKRWYASPALPVLLSLGGLLTVRSNWALYAEEFALALDSVGVAATWRQIQVATPVSAFEAKYQARGHALYEVVSDLRAYAGPPHSST